MGSILESTKSMIHNDLGNEQAKERKEFIETKAGVKGLVDSGVLKIPRIFIHPQENLPNSSLSNTTHDNICLQVPLIDLKSFDINGCRMDIVTAIRNAAQTWGFFQMVNHGVSVAIMDELLKGVCKFHEEPQEVKMEWYWHDLRQQVKYYSNEYLSSSEAASWRDSLACDFLDEQLDAEALPQVCRQAIIKYMKCIIRLKDSVSELLSEALGLGSDYLASIECMKSVSLIGNYYPACPEPELTLGLAAHTDPFFLTLLLQDSVGGLQILHQNQWVDVPHVPGSLIANIGDLMQLVTNDRFTSVRHRVVAGRVGPRVSAACLFLPSSSSKERRYGAVKELLSENNVPSYKETSVIEYLNVYKSKGLDGNSALSHLKFSC